MSKIKAEYIWMDGAEPTQKLRSKTKVMNGPVNSIDDYLYGVLMVQVLTRQLAMIVIVC